MRRASLSLLSRTWLPLFSFSARKAEVCSALSMYTRLSLIVAANPR